ncbi:MAG: ribulose-phosphate 3-epimerase [Candidatus Marinimicrobia bacterium]|nr:ribulose-phosphate 3-epimerase [Candidatus Neomarinimicrobiota bacterium]
MYKNIELSASIMCVDWLNAGQQLKEIQDNDIDYLHIDIIDGNFAPDFTMGSSIIDVFRDNSNLPSDYHLMVEEPDRMFDSFSISKNDNYTIHQESSRNLHRNLISIRRMEANVGVALSPATPLTSLEYIIEDIDLVLIMTVNPGYKGQPLVPKAIRKIKDLRKMINDLELNIKISVDGNVNPETIPDMVAAGADILVLGSSSLFKKDISIPQALEKIYHSIDLGLKIRDENNVV